MKLYVLFEKAYNAEYWEPQGLGPAIGVCFDEQQVNEIVRNRTLSFWRDAPSPQALESLTWFLEHVGYGLDVVLEDDLFWILLDEADAYDRETFIAVEVIAIDVDELPRARAQRRDVIRGLATLLAPWAPDAAVALMEDA